MSEKLTPGAAAQKWAAEHKGYTGRLVIKSLTRAGRGGWKTTVKQTEFIVANGVATARRYFPRVGKGDYCNGFCRSCGKPAHGPELRFVGYAGDRCAECFDKPVDAPRAEVALCEYNIVALQEVRA